MTKEDTGPGEEEGLGRRDGLEEGKGTVASYKISIVTGMRRRQGVESNQVESSQVESSQVESSQVESSQVE